MTLLFDDQLSLPQTERTKSVITDSVARIKALLPLSDVEIKIHLDPARAIAEFGVGGECYDSKRISIALDPHQQHKREAHIPRTLAHEWHHLARWRGPGCGKTLTESIISEGLAENFEIECFPGPPPFYLNALSEGEGRSVNLAFIQEFPAGVYNHSRWFFGTSELPMFAGYDLGYRLIKKYLEIGDFRASHIITLEPRLLLQKIDLRLC